eukprot:5944600-Prymnesium_polylepis.1
MSTRVTPRHHPGSEEDVEEEGCGAARSSHGTAVRQRPTPAVDTPAVPRPPPRAHSPRAEELEST